MKQSILNMLLEARAAKRPAALATHLSSGAQTVLSDGDATGDLPVTQALREAMATALRTDRGGVVTVDDAVLFIQPFNPPLRLIIVGAVHIAQKLAPMGALAGYDVIVIDPRRAFAAGDRFPGVTIRTDWPDEALAALKPDARSAVVTLTHDPKLDDPALESALQSEAFYIAALGSRKTQAERLKRLGERGYSEDSLVRINGPAGLAIGSTSPAEIAISIMAEMTQILHRDVRA